MSMDRRRWYVRLVCVCVCLGTYWSASGLLQLNEVFFQAAAPSGAKPRASASAASGSSVPLPTRAYDRLVVVLIDALRADMVLGSEVMYGRSSSGAAAAAATGASDLSEHMQYTRGLLARGMARAFVAHASVPTVTMPRLKALLTGKPPAFVDLLKNFNSAALTDDNLMQRFRARGDRIVFYGDDTWLKLFPTTFQRQDGTSGFYTRDTVEVDANVTRHLRDELDPAMQHAKSRDWDVLVLHYLGLDHVGHLRGPRSSMMIDKLLEMDAIVQLVFESVRSQDVLRTTRVSQGEVVKPTLVLLCSDHGMSEVGNHGGATVEEASALMAFMRGDGKPVGSVDRGSTRRLQVDLVPTIAALFGLEIPFYSTGRLVDSLVAQPSPTDTTELLKALHANFAQLRTLAGIKFASSVYNQIVAPYTELDGAVESLLDKDLPKQSETELDDVVDKLRLACRELQSKVAQSDGSEYDVHLVTAGVAMLLACAAYSIVTWWKTARLKITKGGAAGRVMLFSFILNILSLTSSSSIENEHATAFFATTSVILAFLVDAVRRQGLQLHSGEWRLPVQLALLLVTNRLLRERNQVINFGRLNNVLVDASAPGSEFASDDSLSILSTNPLIACVPMEMYFVIIYLVVLSSARIRQQGKPISGTDLLLCSAFSFGMLASSVCCHLARNGVHENNGASEWINADTSARAVYAIAVLLVAAGCLSQGRTAVTKLSMALWLLVTLVQRDSNLPTAAILSIQLWLMARYFRMRGASYQLPPSSKVLLASWVSTAAFFALGNSHLVTTIDISQSYHGLQGYSQGIVGMLTFVNVMSGPLVVFISCFDWIDNHAAQAEVVRKSDETCPLPVALLSYQAVRMGIYTITVYAMRFHLFIWSVFAPKMLYEVVFTIVIAIFGLFLA